MPEIDLEKMFARLEIETMGTFHQPPVPALAQRGRRRRWLRRGGVAGLLAAVLAVPVTAANLSDRRDALPPTPPAPVVSESAPASTAPPIRATTPARAPVTIRPARRVAALPGMDLPLRQLAVVDARHAWGWFQRCRPQGGGPCEHALGVTSDAGATWRRVTLPDLAGDPALRLVALDDRTLAIEAVDLVAALTTDGGKTFTTYPRTAAPDTVERAGTEYVVRCPGATGFGGGECARKELVRIGSGPVPAQPTLPGDLRVAVQSANGRLWLVAWEVTGGTVSRTRIAVSADAAATWTELPVVPQRAMLTVSPDGQQVWAVGDEPGGVWQVDGTTLVPRGSLPDAVGATDAKAVGDGGLVVAAETNGLAGFWAHGAFTPLSGVRASGVDVARDGTVSFSTTDGAWVVGTGNGADRTWILIR
jgi:hypothetical protein